MQTTPIGGKAVLCVKCKRDHCPLSGFSGAFQDRICPQLQKFKAVAQSSFEIDSAHFQIKPAGELISPIFYN
jgi:hypothetical protein